MNGKMVVAFVSGALMASGIVYIAIRPAPQTASIADVRPASEPLPPVSVSTAPALAEAAPAPEAQPARAEAKPAPAPPEPEPKPPSQAAPPREHAKLSRTPIREKPSPMPARRVARNEPAIETPPPPVPQSAPEPQPQPMPAPSPGPSQAPPAPDPPASDTTAGAAAPPPPPIVARTAPEPEGRVPHSVVLSAGTPLTVRIGETISAAHHQVGDTFFATLEQPLVIDGFIIAERGSRVVGKVVEAVPAGRGGGESHLRIELNRLNTSDGQHVPIHTDQYAKDGTGSTGGDLAKIGAGAAVGAAIGAIAGGGKGAAIGAGAGAAVGTGAVVISNGRSVEIPVESRLIFRIKDSIKLTEKLD
ncbi:MAG TPA: hypothetical protein VKX49_06030 [Bryobacteraceae bacterium]|nr:hypothetical protein [Bryobacteraceae bacterium]